MQELAVHMTQVFFAPGENNPNIHLKLNQVIQGYRFLGRNVFTALSAPLIFRTNPKTAAIFTFILGPGGGGGGAPAGLSTELGMGGGGGAGGYFEGVTTDNSILRRPFTILAPSGGVGGQAASPGVTVSSAAVVNYPESFGNFYIGFAEPGKGGNYQNAGTFANVAVAGLGGSAGGSFASPDSISMTGEAGGLGLRLVTSGPGVTAIGGRGGRSRLGGVARECIFSNGNDASSFGGGGGGACSIGVTFTSGGKGGDSLVVIDEYY